jgi:hypothetical protein
LAFNFEFKCGWRIGHFCPNWAFNIAKLGSKTSPKSEVEAIDWLIEKQKSPACRALLFAKLSAEKGLSAAQGSNQIGTPHSAMKCINN